LAFPFNLIFTNLINIFVVMENISKHITFKEATFSATAARLGLKNEPTEEHLKAMKLVAEKCFEPLREWYGKPLRIN
jgi:hypothetical protein